MTVWIYVDTGKQVGDRNHLKVFANEDAAETWCRKTTRRASRSNMRFWNEPPTDSRRDLLSKASPSRSWARLFARWTSVLRRYF
jgi:hypothetical protein